jgi:hypothetical protein
MRRISLWSSFKNEFANSKNLVFFSRNSVRDHTKLHSTFSRRMKEKKPRFARMMWRIILTGKKPGARFADERFSAGQSNDSDHTNIN